MLTVAATAGRDFDAVILRAAGAAPERLLELLHEATVGAAAPSRLRPPVPFPAALGNPALAVRARQ